MHVGLGMAFQNPPNTAWTDLEVYRDEFRLADRGEELGFESIWAAEHHFTDYVLCPDVYQFLTYLAGRTKRVELGSMVVVLPWHDPVWVAEKVAMLDNLSEGRVVLGIGRGAGRVEFEGYRIPMDESRERFVESAHLILNALETGYIEGSGRFFQQPRREIRPRPFKTFKGRTYAAAISPESYRIMAELGIGLLFIPQKPWETIAQDFGAYRAVYQEVHGVDAPASVAVCWVFCDEDPGRAEELGHRYIGGYYESALKHYELAGAHFQGMKGYEYYEKMAGVLTKAGEDTAKKFFADLQVWGTPDQCFEKILRIREQVNCDRFVGVFKYADMPFEEANRNLELFARAVAPRLKAVGPLQPAQAQARA